MEYVVGTGAPDWLHLVSNGANFSQRHDLHLNAGVPGAVQPQYLFDCGWGHLKEMSPQDARRSSSSASPGEYDSVSSCNSHQFGCSLLCKGMKGALEEEKDCSDSNTLELSLFHSGMVDELLHETPFEQPPHAAAMDTVADVATHPSALSQVGAAPPTTLCGLFSSDKTWVNESLSSAVWGTSVPNLKSNVVSHLAPVREFTGSCNTEVALSYWPKTGTQAPSHALVGTTHDTGRCSSLPKCAPPSSQKRRSIEQLMAQLTTDTDDASATRDGSHLTAILKQPNVKATSFDCPSVEGQRKDFLEELLAKSRTLNRRDCSRGTCSNVSLLDCGRRPCCRPPLAVGCSPLSSPLESGPAIESFVTESDDGGRSTAVPAWLGSTVMDSLRTVRSSDYQSGQSYHLCQDPTHEFVLNRSTLSGFYRNSSHSRCVGGIIDDSCFTALKSAEEWPPRTKDDASRLLGRLQAKELLQHLVVVSFSRKHTEDVLLLFGSWKRKRITPPDVQFGLYYWYTIKWRNERLCLKHNGCGPAAGKNRGCVYALRGSHRKCRYPHKCLFCGAGDHGWVEEDRCSRYLSLQGEMKRLGVTNDIASVLLNAIECEK
ncbi:hypothetical protein TraAM80_00487 [Trypanosoma rangeli]|uniref:Uncharacterized protein n=1 Tax=Trypanosoma rangeli TaxID=5698 RepID=A0A3R7P3K7_TRYRA|nr:uncharacterized protein TraAM80_00487 [Trypanosoma rangeli]RNF12205.1 hypothetical protein TraAM80_00487 [Trypanosoma rangeli]|eukprot:RNF12205.1 hypothetical protein TraAM80_00487 [Trypanosoma rangeli]